MNDNNTAEQQQQDWWENVGAAQEQWSDEIINGAPPQQPQSSQTVIQMTLEELDARIAQGAQTLMQEMLSKQQQQQSYQQLQQQQEQQLSRYQQQLGVSDVSSNSTSSEEEVDQFPNEMNDSTNQRHNRRRRSSLTEDHGRTMFNNAHKNLETKKEKRASMMEESERISQFRLGMSQQTLLKEKEKAEDDEEWHTPFGESTYTLLFMCEFPSQAFCYACFVYFLQMITITLTLVDIIDAPWRSDNPLRLPPMVDLTVTLSQGVTLFLALAYQSDLIEAVLKLQEGFYPEITVTYPGATFRTWIFSCTAQLLAGLNLLTTIFVLTMQVADVLSIMLNFAALHFMAEIDDLGFSLAKLGFITDELQREVNQVCDFELPKRKVSNIWRRILYFGTLLGLFIGYGIIKRRQLIGVYLSTYVYVQFGDAFNERLPYYSGLLKSQTNRTFGHRLYRDIGTSDLLLSYCSPEKAWTFSYSGDPCNYIAKSSETKTYDVTSIPNAEWEVFDSYLRLQPFESFSLVSRDCTPDDDLCQGDCIEELCHCRHHQFGLDCQFGDVCPDFDIHGKYEPFPQATLSHWAISDEFQLLQNSAREYVRVNNFPVYYSSKTYPANVIFFTGKRWILTGEEGLFNLTAAREVYPYRVYFPEKTVEVLENEFHGYHKANYIPFFLSDPVDFETKDFLPTPGGLGWWTVRIVDPDTRHYVPDSQLNTFLTCKTCKEEHGGFCDSVGGECNDNGDCICFEGYFGNTCELQEECYESDGVQCGGHGVCDTNSGHCRCRYPYYGKLCEVQYYCFEEYGACRNEGRCNLTSTECVCGEDPAVTGIACEEFRNCKVTGCSNGGLCRPSGFCECRPPFTGYLCDVIDSNQKGYFCSSDSDCQNGVCNQDTGICDCAEGSGSFGTLCEHQYNCSASKYSSCLNSGICNSTSGICECPDPYFGPDCSELPDCMMDADCIYEEPMRKSLGPSPSCDTSTGKCQNCQPHREGKLCEKLTHCASYGCFYDGNCNSDGYCTCPPPYTGNNCDYLLTDDLDLDQTTVKDTQFLRQFEECGFPPFSEGASFDCA